MAEIDLLPDQDRSACAVFEVRLQPGETLIWAERADPKVLASYYFRKPLLYGSLMFVTVFVFFLLAVTDGFTRGNIALVLIIFVGALFMGSSVSVWEAMTRGAWHWQDINHHYYALTDRRLLRSIGGGRPRTFNKLEKISGLSVEGPQDEEALGDIQFYRDTGMDHQTHFRFHGIRRARKVAVIKAQLAIGS